MSKSDLDRAWQQATALVEQPVLDECDKPIPGQTTPTEHVFLVAPLAVTVDVTRELHDAAQHVMSELARGEAALADERQAIVLPAPRYSSAGRTYGEHKALRGFKSGQIATQGRLDKASLKVQGTAARLDAEQARRDMARANALAAGQAVDMSKPFDLEAHRAKQRAKREKRRR